MASKFSSHLFYVYIHLADIHRIQTYILYWFDFALLCFFWGWYSQNNTIEWTENHSKISPRLCNLITKSNQSIYNWISDTIIVLPNGIAHSNRHVVRNNWSKIKRICSFTSSWFKETNQLSHQQTSRSYTWKATCSRVIFIYINKWTSNYHSYIDISIFKDMFDWSYLYFVFLLCFL